MTKAYNCGHAGEHAGKACAACLAAAYDRIDRLVEVIQALKACYHWDRSEYQTHKGLAEAVERQLKLVRLMNRNSSHL